MKRGQTAPWKISVQFGDDKPFKRAFSDRDAAMFGARESLRAAQHRDLTVTVRMWSETTSGDGSDAVRLVLDDEGEVTTAP